MELVKYNEACRAVAEARSVDEVKDIRDKSDAMRTYAQQAKNKQLEIDCAGIRFRAERRLGEMIQAQKENGGLAKPGPKIGSPAEPNSTPTLAEVGIDKKLSSRAQKLASIPEAKFEETISDWRDRVSIETERVTVRLIREGEQQMRHDDMTVAPFPSGVYPIIYADPPWRYEHMPKGDANRSIENQYPTMELVEIMKLPVSGIAAKDSALFLWATAPKLDECMAVIASWGFEYRTCMVWVKDRIGMGYYARSRHELLLIARRGELPVPSPSDRPDSVIEAPRLEHSAKPGIVYDIIDRMYPGLPKVELFARNKRDGWDSWGNQI